MSVHRRRAPRHRHGAPNYAPIPTNNDAGYHIAEAVARLVELRDAWPWLSAFRTPGTPSYRHERSIAAAAEHARAEQWHKDRVAAAEAIRCGRVPSAPHAAATNLAAVHARARIAADVAALTAAVLTACELPTVRPVIRQGTHVLVGACQPCRGTGRTLPPRWWPAGQPWPARPAGSPDEQPWVPDPVPCRHCHAGEAVAVVAYDLPDAIMTTAVGLLADLLPRVTDAELADRARHVLERANRMARATVGVDTEDLRRLPARCPACGLRELHAEVSSLDEMQWSVHCLNGDCRCVGPDCGCGRAVRWPGRRHRWGVTEWSGPDGLATRLGVDMTALAHGRHGGATRTRSAPLTTTRQGHGGRS
ncbi:hypothetical protein [Salinispora vitiensis]|uniref:hypothetical protein n=1 Tax=Salinispora vitiensis TaxID=999544 RepID=UPI00037625AF|nr:hypothetical protein [Salinispora vitiensis]